MFLRIIKVSKWFEAFFLEVFTFLNSTINDVIHHYFYTRIFNKHLLQENTILNIIKIFQRIISESQNSSSIAPNEEV